ncbi:peroxide stress protein YaaA [Paludibacterium yongneupense]|uniref:peroxide stress protein YaaA n=1 Tax=Paludibacterium yongneupense TaxID=400061 RepID=UPI0003F89EF1|nr:peroxide stress protein YaaA [Paludibacterium yongneupense]
MLMLISPAKTLDFDTPAGCDRHSVPEQLEHSAELISILSGKSPADLSALMGISDALAVLNAGRFSHWHTPFTPRNAKQAVLAFMGDVYEGLDAASLDDDSLDWLQRHLGILSGLYGLLRPLDLIQPYRLEMGTRLATARGRDLYAFWGDLITAKVAARLTDDRVLINLASGEYFKSVRTRQLAARVITPVFQDRKAGQYKVISFHAKRARGLMVRWAVQHRVADPLALQGFDGEGYAFAPDVSDADNWVFRRDAADGIMPRT